MTGDVRATDGHLRLERQILPDRFQVIDDPLGWRCRGCGAEVTAPATDPFGTTATTIARLSESAADHGLFCGRCND